MKEYNIVITETLRSVVCIEADNAAEAGRLVEEKWRNGEIVLGGDEFSGVSFTEEGRAKNHRTGNKGKGNIGYER